MTATDRTPESTTVLATRLLGTTGVGLLLAAAISLVSARWELFGPGPRLGVLLGASAVLVVITHQLRRLAPSTARSLDVLVAAMVPIDTAAAAIVSGGSWRVALVAAGPMAVVAGVGLYRRGMPTVADASYVVGGVLAVAGVAAQSELHGPLLLAAAAAVAAMILERDRVRVPLVGALIAGFAPIGRLFDEVVFTGMGTMRELGLIDPVDLPIALATGALSSAALVVVALRTRSSFVGLGAAAVAVTTGFELWAIAEPPPETGLLAATVVLALIELADPRRWSAKAENVELIESLNAMTLGVVTALMAGAAWAAYVDDPVALSETPLIAGVAGAGWLFGALRRTESWLPAPIGSAACTAVVAFLVTDDAVVLAAVLLVAGVSLGLLRRPAHHVLGSVVVVVAPFVAAPETTEGTIALLAGVAAMSIALIVRRRGDDPAFSGTALLAVLLLGLVVGGSAAVATDLALAALAVSVLWSAVGNIVRAVNPPAAATLRSLALVGPLGAAGDHPWIGVALAAGLLALAAIEYALDPSTSRLALVGAATAAGSVTVLRALDIDLLDAYLLPVLWAIVVTAVHTGASASVFARVGLFGSALIGIGGRLDDGDALHTAILGLVAVGVAMWAGRAGDRPTLVVSCPLAVAVAAFDLLDRSVGIEGWGWLVVGGAAAVTAAAVLERQDREPAVGASVR